MVLGVGHSARKPALCLALRAYHPLRRHGAPEAGASSGASSGVSSGVSSGDTRPVACLPGVPRSRGHGVRRPRSTQMVCGRDGRNCRRSSTWGRMWGRSTGCGGGGRSGGGSTATLLLRLKGSELVAMHQAVVHGRGQVPVTGSERRRALNASEAKVHHLRHQMRQGITSFHWRSTGRGRMYGHRGGQGPGQRTARHLRVRGCCRCR